jgi:hypothetical protein
MAAATATDVLANYRDSKKNLDKLATAARKQMQARFTELLAEAAGIQADFKNDFGVNPELPATVKTFTLGEKKKADPTDAVANGKKVGGLRRSLTAAIKNGETTRIAEISAQLAALGIDVAAPEAPAPAPKPTPVAAAEPEGDDEENGPGADPVDGEPGGTGIEDF